MSLSSTTSRNDYTGNGSVSSYSYNFKIFLATDLLVTIADLATPPNQTPLVLNTDFTVSGAGNISGGSIALVNSGQSWLASGNLKTGYHLTVRRVRPLTQTTDIRNQGSFFPSVHEDTFDQLVMLDQQLQDQCSRAVIAPETLPSTTFNPTLPTNINQPSISLITNPAGDGFAPGPTADQIANAQTYSTNALASQTAAASSATSAASSATAAATSATAAQTAADSVMWNAVVFKTAADSPIAIDSTFRGNLVVIDCTSGPVIVNLPQISTLTLTTPYSVGIKKSDSSGNTVTINRAGTDTIDGATSKVLSTPGNGSALTPENVTTPEEWISADFGASAGNMTKDVFSGDGSTTAFTLSVSPGSVNNTQVYIGGVYQQKSGYTVSGTTLTFLTAPPTGASNIECISGTTLSAGVPTDGTVTRAKMAVGGIARSNVVAKTANYTATDSDDVIFCDASGGAFTVTLPAASGETGRIFTIIKKDVSTNAVTVSRSGSDLISGEISQPIAAQYNSIDFISDGSNWYAK